MKNEKLISKCLVLFHLNKNSCSPNLGISKKLRNLLVYCVGMEIALLRQMGLLRRSSLAT